MRLIDGDELSRLLWEKAEDYPRGDGRSKLKFAALLADSMDTIDGVHAAGGCYCRECKYRGAPSCAMAFECECGWQGSWEDDADFCSYGEWREGENHG